MPMSRGTPDLVRHCVAAVAKQYDNDTSKAFAICVASLQKAGYLKPGTMELTAAGKKKEKEHEAEPDAEKKLASYEKLLKANRKEEASKAKKPKNELTGTYEVFKDEDGDRLVVAEIRGRNALEFKIRNESFMVSPETAKKLAPILQVLSELIEGKGYQCMECGRKMKRPAEECPKCGGSDIDLAEGTESPLDFFESLANPAVTSGFEGIPTTVARRYESVTKGETGMDAMRRLAGIVARGVSLTEAVAAIAKGPDGYEATPEKVAAVLEKLTIGKGGKGTRQQLTADDNFSLSFYETPRERNSKEYPYTLELRYTYNGQYRQRPVPLKKEEVFTKSKSMWARDSVWRMKPEAVQKYSEQIAKMLTDPRATQSDKPAKAEAAARPVAREDSRLDRMRRLAGIAVAEATDPMEVLATALKTQKLPTSDGEMRKASAKEFMLMSSGPINGKWQFKHADTRNYLFVDAKTGKLIIPKSNEPFMRGTFDAL